MWKAARTKSPPSSNPPASCRPGAAPAAAARIAASCNSQARASHWATVHCSGKGETGGSNQIRKSWGSRARASHWAAMHCSCRDAGREGLGQISRSSSLELNLGFEWHNAASDATVACL